MKKTITLITLITLLLVSLTTAIMEEPQENMCSQEAQKVCEILMDLQITEGLKVPFILPKNGVINTYFFNEEIIGHIKIKDGALEELVCCIENPEPTHEAKIKDFKTIEELKTSEDALTLANEKLSEGEITIQAKNFTNKARLAIGKFFLKVASWF